MKLTKFPHSCIRLEDRGRTLVVDPGVFSDAATALEGADGVLITHEHADHIDADALLAAAEANPALAVWAPSAVTHTLPSLGERARAVKPGETFDAVGFSVSTFGGQHALIHESVPVIDNVGFLINDAIYHPGDSFSVPNMPVHTLCVPTHAPWSKLAEVMDFVMAVRAKQGFQIHDGLLNPIGIGNAEGHIGRVAANFGTSYQHVDAGEVLTF